MIKKSILYILLLLSMSPDLVMAQDTKALIDEANQHYFSKNLDEAKSAYLSIIESGVDNGHVYYNLGNIYYRLGQLGQALYYYEQSKRLMPRDPDLSANIEFLEAKRHNPLREPRQHVHSGPEVVE